MCDENDDKIPAPLGGRSFSRIADQQITKGLFARERRELMDRWASEVPCRELISYTSIVSPNPIIDPKGINCPGVLRWLDNDRKQLVCSHCGTEYNVFRNHK